MSISSVKNLCLTSRFIDLGLWVTCRKQSRGGELIEWVAYRFIHSMWIHPLDWTASWWDLSLQTDSWECLFFSGTAFRGQTLMKKLILKSIMLKCFIVCKKASCLLLNVHQNVAVSIMSSQKMTIGIQHLGSSSTGECVYTCIHA